MQLTHRFLCDIAVKWLKRSNSNGGHGCHVAVSEVQSGWQGEIPDAIGFRNANGYVGSVMVEVKVSRGDFLADKKKAHRNGQTVGLGNWRYYMCPADLIQPSELPPKFGLLYVNNRGHVKPVVSPFLTTNFNDQRDVLETMKFSSNVNREQFLLVRLLSRVGDAEKLNNSLKEARNTGVYFERKYRDISRDHDKSRQEFLSLNREFKLLKGSDNG
ncbi:hypothetical protein Sps_05149 [Shewanella psychrophila]|uniref:Adenylosuccinate synthase n=1 Tax=Shewanella psychrophila TaxID=225848 RepID=A0A1S6HXS4_9GAMM|nr:hypothetical protein [Shewanella psychrophila]AQS40218.1 hypothetical protein Sps_05149 [Shewanella psychrophila]